MIVLLPASPRVTWAIECNATPEAAGGYSQTKFFAARLVQDVLALKLPIAQLEVLALLVRYFPPAL